MVTFEQALKLILSNTKQLLAQNVNIVNSVGMFLNEDVYSNIDMPPFNKSAMDGYALFSENVKDIPITLKCVDLIQAGDNFIKKINFGECVKIMTGAPVPLDTDSVVMVENTVQRGDYVEINKAVKKGENVCVKGEDIRAGQKVLSKGRKICISDISLLAAVGRAEIKAFKRPKVAVLNTGGEIVPPGQKLGENSIYNSNGPQLCSLLKSDSFEYKFLGIAKDDPDELENAIKEGLNEDVLLISGGVSMGDYDMVPSILEKLGVVKVFHEVKIKPGKPLFFGIKQSTIVFGIPGNPVSNFLSYIVFIRPALNKMMGDSTSNLVFSKGTITKDLNKKSGRKHFIPVKASVINGKYYLDPLVSHGSADILTLSKANGFVVLNEEESVVNAGALKDFILWK